VTDEEKELLRVRTAQLDPVSRAAILKNMSQLYPYRIVHCPEKTVEEEVALYPHLKEPCVVSRTFFSNLTGQTRYIAIH
jgi:hypothetical protein